MSRATNCFFLRKVTVSVVITVFYISVVSAVPLGLPEIKPARAIDPAKVALGKKLFFDKSISVDGTVSCSSCHRPELAFSDGKPKAEGVGGQFTTRNAPSLLNVGFNTSLFWDGRRDSLEDQATDPLLNPREHGLRSMSDILRKIEKDNQYKKLFASAFPNTKAPFSIHSVRVSLANYQRTIISGDSMFDKYFYGQDESAISNAAKRGFALFTGSAGCSKCHTVNDRFALFTDNSFHSLNVGLQPLLPRLDQVTTKLVRARVTGISLDEEVISQEDIAELGRFAITLDPIDIGRFRTPSLRNVALTSPYMHDGSVATLEQAIERELYRSPVGSNRGTIFTPIEKQDIGEFLKTLTGSEMRRIGSPTFTR